MELGLENAFEGLQVNLVVPDLWQQEAIRAARGGEDVIVSAPTGAGKTLVFETLVDGGKFPPSGKQVVYTVPTRALANDKWREWKAKGWRVGIATGDVAEDLSAPVIVATLETQRERFLAGEGPHMLVIDEYQMIGDRQRGLNYELAVALAPATTRLLFMSGSVYNPHKVQEWLQRLGRTARVVETKDRPVPLEEIPIEVMPRSAPRKIRNFWQRMAVGALLSNYGPLLIFAPHRKSAEKIAWKIAEVLPDDDPVSLGGHALESLASADLKRLLKKRVAFHHSGLGFAERAAIIEPLAKAGQLRVIVATMGLASGINFSVRSVFVGETTYQEGPFQRQVRPDELLQMFGRAGRRGLDETGYLITGRESPSLNDARARDLRRKNELDWPTLIRRMHHAAEKGESAIEAARALRDRLFSEQQLSLGFRDVGSAEDIASGEGGSLFNLKPIRKEVLESNGKWSTFRAGSETRTPLGEGLRFIKGRYRPAESDSRYISRFLPDRTRLCRLDAKGRGPRRYGLEIAVATLARDESGFFLTKFASHLVGEKRKNVSFSKEEIEQLLPPYFAEVIQPASFEAIVLRGRTLHLTGHFREMECDAHIDSEGKALFEPEMQSIEIAEETHFTDEHSGVAFETAAGTPAHAWRKLALIDESGVPTDRGVIFSLFQAGEGFAVAALLEDTQYPVEEGLRHLANVRAGYRFELDTVVNADLLIEGEGSERLAASCRQAYGPVDYEGYLALGLPTNYGEGAAEVIGMMQAGTLHQLMAKAGRSLDFGTGDVERAYIEWLSLLRHIHHAPDLDHERWTELKEAAARELKKSDRRSPLSDLPELPASTLQKRAQNRIHISQL